MASSLPLLLLVLCSLTVAEAQLKLYNLRASDLPSNLLGTTDGYVRVFSGPDDLGKTSVRNNNANPWWEEEFSNFKAQENDILRLEVHDSDLLFDDLLGVCQRQMKLGTHEHDCFLEKDVFDNIVENDVLKLEVHVSDIVFDDLVGTCQQPVVLGTYAHECMLEKGGTLHYEYTLS